MNTSRALLSTAVLLALSSRVSGVEPEKKASGPISFYRDIRPIFVQNCQGCHQPAKQGGGFVMTSYAKLLKAGDHEMPGVVPGKPAESYVVEQIHVGDNGKAAMPRGKDPLAKKDIDLITRWIAEGAKDDTPKTAVDLIDAAHPPVYRLPPVITALDFSPDSKLLAVPGYHEVLIYQSDEDGGYSGQPVRLIGQSERINAVAFSPDGNFLAAAGGSPGRFGEVQIWDVKKKKLKHSTVVTFDTLYGVSWSHDGTKLAFGCADNSLRAIDAENGQQILFQGAHTDWVLGTVFSKDSTYLVSISRDRSMKLTEVASQRFIDNITSITPGALKGGLQTVARNPQKTDQKVKNTDAGTDKTEKWYDELLIGGSDGVPRLYKMHRTKKRVIGDDFNKIRDYSTMPGRIYAVAFRPDGKQFAAGSSLDGKGEVRIYETETGKVAAKMDGQPGAVYALAWRPDGERIAVAGFDGIVRLIDPVTGKVVNEFVAVPLKPTKR